MAEGDHSLRYMEHDSILHRTYPLIKLIWVVMVAVALLFFREPRSGFIMLVTMFVMALVFARMSLRDIIGSAKFIFSLGIFLMFFHFFADPGEPVYSIGPFTITDGGLYQGPTYFFRLSAIVLASFVLIWTTDIRDLMVSLTKAGMPYRFAFAIFLSLRFLPLIQREIDAVKAAHMIRGKATRSRLVYRIRLWQRYMFTVLINGLRKAEAMATAIEVRGFGAYPDRTYLKTVNYKPLSLLLIVVFVILTGALIFIERTF